MGRAYGEPQSWAYCTTTFDGVATPVNASSAANAPGINFATSGTANVDGTAVTVLSALAHDVHRLVFHVGGLTLNAGQSACLADLLVDPAGGTSWASVWDDIIVGHSPVVSAANGLFAYRYEIPLYIKAGSSVGIQARGRNASAFAEGRISMSAFGEPSDPDQWWCCEKVETLGSDAANSNGTLVTPGNTGTMGAWTSIGSASAYRYGAIMLGVQGDNSAGLAQAGYYLEAGFGSARVPGTPLFYVVTTTGEVVLHDGGFAGEFIGCDIAAGTQMEVRATQTGSAANTLGVCLYGAVR